MDRRDFMAENAKQLQEGFDEVGMTWGVEVEDDNGDIEFVELPAAFEVCGTCQGKGSHVNPSIDSHGITEREWSEEWDQDDRENYTSGAYDVTCYECSGRRVVGVINSEVIQRANNSKWNEALDHRRDQMEADAQYAAECAAERAYGC